MASTYDPSTGAATTGDEDALLARVWTLPNAITVSRLVLLGAFLAALFPLHERFVAFFLLGVTGITDFLDGYIARRYNQVTTIGKIIDPSVDRVVLITSVVGVVVFGAVPVWLAVVVLGREVIVSATVLVLAALGAARIDVNWFGKAGTFGLMCNLPLFVLAHGPGGWTHAVEVTAWVIVVPALAFSFYGAVLYVPAARRALAAGRRGADRAST